MVGTESIAEIEAEWIGPEGWVDDSDVFFADSLWIVAVLLVEAVFEGVVHGVDGSFTGFVAGEGVKIGLLYEK